MLLNSCWEEYLTGERQDGMNEDGQLPDTDGDLSGAAGQGQDSESIGRLLAEGAAEIGVKAIVWVAPLVILGGLGILLVNAGTHETVNSVGMSTTEISQQAVFGFAFISFAAAVFFGRGSISAIVRVIRGEGEPGDILFMQGNVIGSLIAIGAVVIGVVLMIVAALDLSPSALL